MSIEAPKGQNLQDFFNEMAEYITPLNQYTIPSHASILYCASQWEGRGDFAHSDVTRDRRFCQANKSQIDDHTCRLYDIRQFLCEEDWIGSTAATLEMCVPETTPKLLELFKETFPEMLSEMKVAGPSHEAKDPSTPEASSQFKFHLVDIKPPGLSTKSSSTPEEEPTSDSASPEKIQHEAMWTALLEQPSALYIEPNRLELRRKESQDASAITTQHYVMEHDRLIHLALIQRAKSLMQSRAMLNHQTALLVRYLCRLADIDEPTDEDYDTIIPKLIVDPHANQLWSHLDKITTRVDQELLHLRALLVVLNDLNSVVVCCQCKELIAVTGREPAKIHCAEQLQILAQVEKFEDELETLRAQFSESKQDGQDQITVATKIGELEAKLHPLLDQLADGGLAKRKRIEQERAVAEQKAKSEKMVSKLQPKSVQGGNTNTNGKNQAQSQSLSKQEAAALERLLREEDAARGRRKKGK